MSSEDHLPEEQLDAILRRCSATTRGPWRSSVEYFQGRIVADDQDFVAHAKQDVPMLVAEIRRLRLVRAYEAMVATRIARIGKGLAIIEALARDTRHEPPNVPPLVPPLPLAPAVPNDEVSFTLDLFWDSFG